MTGYLLRRLLRGAVTVLVSITITFIVLRVMPGDPALLLGETRMTEELRQQIRAQYGLDRPLVVQYAHYLWDLARGDLGTSFRQLRPVADILLEKIPWTLLLTGTSFIFTVLLGVPLGVAAAVRRGSWVDRLVNAFAVIGHAVFVPWLAITLLYFLGYHWALFPIGGARALDAQGAARIPSVIHHLVLPAATLVLVNLATYVLLMRTSMIDTLQEDYVRTARAKGAPPRSVVYRHALRNAILPTLTMMGLQLGHLVGGAVLTETVFAYPGVGRLIYDAVRELDYPVLQGAFIILAVTVVVANIVTDLAYGLFDPRIRFD